MQRLGMLVLAITVGGGIVWTLDPFELRGPHPLENPIPEVRRRRGDDDGPSEVTADHGASGGLDVAGEGPDARKPPPDSPGLPTSTGFSPATSVEDFLSMADTPREREVIRRHVHRFLVSGPLHADDPVDAQFAALQKAKGAWARQAPAVPFADRVAARTRARRQLERVEERDAAGLLEALDAALIWLALHQDRGGRISDEAAAARCRALGHGAKEDEPDCLALFGAEANDEYAVGATALALLAFLEFRDQDARGIFELHLAQGLRWLLAQQRPDGTFPGKGQLYASAMAVMALGEAAAGSGSEVFRTATSRGLMAIARQAGPRGGYRYGPRQAGDLSVSAWVAQAIERARKANAAIPDGMEDGLRLFLHDVWRNGSQFAYLQGQASPRASLGPAGMLMSRLLWTESEEQLEAEWKEWLQRPRYDRDPPDLYSLYYGLRATLHFRLTLDGPWRRWAFAVAAEQVRDGDATGMMPASLDAHVGLYGPVVTTSLGALVLAHALHER